MSKVCELCDRAYSRGVLTPTWWVHQDVCDRANCRTAAKDSLLAITDARERFNDVVSGMAQRREKSQHAPIGYRKDTMCEMDVVKNDDWWALEIAKRER